MSTDRDLLKRLRDATDAYMDNIDAEKDLREDIKEYEGEKTDKAFKVLEELLENNLKEAPSLYEKLNSVLTEVDKQLLAPR